MKLLKKFCSSYRLHSAGTGYYLFCSICSLRTSGRIGSDKPERYQHVALVSARASCSLDLHPIRRAVEKSIEHKRCPFAAKSPTEPFIIMSEAKDDGMTAEERTNWLRERVSSGEKVGGESNLCGSFLDAAVRSVDCSSSLTFLTLNSVGSPY